MQYIILVEKENNWIIEEKNKRKQTWGHYPLLDESLLYIKKIEYINYKLPRIYKLQVTPQA